MTIFHRLLCIALLLSGTAWGNEQGLALKLAGPLGTVAAAPETDPLLEGAIAAASAPELSSRVVNGIEAPEGKYPFMAFLLRRRADGGLSGCGGAQITPDWVLTAAHCVVVREGDDGRLASIDSRSLQVRRGSNNWNTATPLEVAEVVPYPEYGRDHRLYHDIALVRLRHPSDRPTVPLPPAGLDPGAGIAVNIVGWGRTGAEKDAPSAERLREARTQLVDRGRCAEIHEAVKARIRQSKPDYVGNGPIDQTRICAEVSETNRPVDSCQGDSGGPLLAETNAGFVAVGIVSYGYSCAIRGVHGVYTNIGFYRDWIESVIGRQGVSDVPEPGNQGGDGPADITGIEGEAEVIVELRGGTLVRPNAPLVFDVTSALSGQLMLFDMGPDGSVSNIFPNTRTERGRVRTTLQAGRRFTTPTERHGFRFRAPSAPGERIIIAAVLDPAIQKASGARARGLGLVPEPRDFLSETITTILQSCAKAGVSCGIGAVRIEVR